MFNSGLDCLDGRFENEDIRASLNFQNFIYHDCKLEKETIMTQNGSFEPTVHYAGTKYELVYDYFGFFPKDTEKASL